MPLISLNSAEWLALGPASRRAGYSPEYVRLLGLRGTIATIDLPSGRVYRVADLDRLAERRQARHGGVPDD